MGPFSFGKGYCFMVDSELEALKKSLTSKFSPAPVSAQSPPALEAPCDPSAILSTLTREFERLSQDMAKLQSTMSGLVPSADLLGKLDAMKKLLDDLHSQQQSLQGDVHKILAHLG